MYVYTGCVSYRPRAGVVVQPVERHGAGGEGTQRVQYGARLLVLRHHQREAVPLPRRHLAQVVRAVDPHAVDVRRRIV